MTSFTEKYTEVGQRLLDRFLAGSPDFVAALISTIDGRLMLERSRREIGGTRVASMSSSLIALSEALGGELSMKPCSHVTVSTEAGVIVLLRIGGPGSVLTLTTVARQGVNLGTLLASSRRAANELNDVNSEFAIDLSASAET